MTAPIKSITFKFEETKDGENLLKRRNSKNEGKIQEAVQESEKRIKRNSVSEENFFFCSRCSFPWEKKASEKNIQDKVTLCWMCYKETRERIR